MKKLTKAKKPSVSHLFAAAFLTLLAMMDYPFIAQYIHERAQERAADRFELSLETLPEKEEEAFLAEADAYNQSLWNGGGFAADVFGTGFPGQDEESGILGTLEIPTLELYLPVFCGTEEDSLQNGAGCLEGSSLPVGGENTHTCLAGHRGLPGKRLFTDLDLLKEGDVFTIHTAGRELVYQVYRTETVTPDRTESLSIERGEDLATLITCTPYGINSHRLYVHGRRIPPEQIKAAGRAASWRTAGLLLVNAGLLLWLTALLFRYGWKTAGKERTERKEERKKV